MADTLRTRVARVIAGGAHALLDKIEDAAPVAMFDQSLREVDVVTDDVRTELGRVAASRHLAQQQHQRLNAEHTLLEASVATALAESREDLARTAVARQLDIEAQLPVLEGSLGDLAQQEKELASYVDALKGKRREMEAAVRDFEASRRAVAAPAPCAPAGSADARLDAAENAFKRHYERQTGLNPASRGTTLQEVAKLRQLDELVRNNKIDERLAAFKAKV